MNKQLWTASIAAIIVGLCSVCRADSAPLTPADSAQPASYSAAALYNLGNSYARLGKPALAVLNYERALLLAPLDPDIRANLRHVRDAAGLVPERRWPGDSLRWLSPNTTYWAGFAGLLAAGAAWLLLSFRPSHRLASRALLGSGLLLMAFAMNDALAIERLQHRAVVMEAAAASASPISGGDPLFTVPPASIVQQEDEHGGFSLIRDSQGRIGWVTRDRLIFIIDSPRNHDART
jgi:tetratricopeptide (TPR) repeat protein